MSISSLGSGSAASQLAYVSKLQSSGGGGKAEGMPPPPSLDGGGFISAIADALKSIGVSTASASGNASDTEVGGATGSTDIANAAQALGSFLQELMGALHEQGGAPSETPQYGEPSTGGISGTGGTGRPGGAGKLAGDLQSLISKLASGGNQSSERVGAADGAGVAERTDNTGSTNSTDSAYSTDSSSALKSSFKDLLSALGSDGSDAPGQLGSFLQALASKLPQAGSSGNLINTKA